MNRFFFFLNVFFIIQKRIIDWLFPKNRYSNILDIVSFVDTRHYGLFKELINCVWNDLFIPIALETFLGYIYPTDRENLFSSTAQIHTFHKISDTLIKYITGNQSINKYVFNSKNILVYRSFYVWQSNVDGIILDNSIFIPEMKTVNNAIIGILITVQNK